jgi:predicted Zn-dependent protease
MVIFLWSCISIYNPATERKEFILIDTDSEVYLGKLMANQINHNNKISKNLSLNKRLQRIGQRVAMVSHRNNIEYHFFIIEHKDLNAFALPGGFIYVHKAVMDIATDDELACVLAHEIAHVAARHSVKKLQAALGYQIIMSLAFKRVSSRDLYRVIDIFFNIVSLGYSRADERLADRLAVRYSYRAGYNPEGMISFFKKLKAQAEKRGQNYNLIFLSSHPPLDERINNVRKEIELSRQLNQ